MSLLRPWAIACALTIGGSVMAAGSTAESLDDVLQRLRAADWVLRSKAVDQVMESPQLRSAPAAKRALIQLLDRENKSLKDPHRAVRSEEEAEAYANYYSTLLSRVDLLIDPRDVASISILVQSAYNPDSSFALKLASYGQTVVPSLLKLAADPDPERRSDSYEVLGQVLRHHRLGTSRFPLTTEAVREVENRLRSGLRDPASFVRGSAIRGVKAAGDIRSLPILERLRTSDPYEAGPHKYLIREEAAEAIAAIKEHPLGK